MQTVRQSMRPKHQVLVLKCYPRYQKNVHEVKPNSNELSYLLYYASTRRSKTQKVAAFLERRTLRDASKGRTGNIQVTLQILRALIEKVPRDLSLYAAYVLRILLIVFQHHDLTTAEDSVATFEEFCLHQDAAPLAADQELTRLYEEIVQTYAGFADAPPAPAKGSLSTPLAIRWKAIGLRAIRSITASPLVALDNGRPLSLIMPTLLKTLDGGSEEQLMNLNQKAGGDREIGPRRRTSIATARTSESTAPPNPTATGSTADADRAAEEEIQVIALQSLRQVFTANSRSQIRMATSSFFGFLMDSPATRRPTTSTTEKSVPTGRWATTLLELVARITPVQDRFVIAVTAVETLVRRPTAEEDLPQQLVLATLIDSLLASSINMIGLSVMDVLLGLIAHILLVLQLGGQGTQILPHHQQTDAIDLFDDGPSKPPSEPVPIPKVAVASTDRQDLLLRLQQCIGNLATHIYYSDQISDIISAIFLRLKPSPQSGLGSPVAAIENPDAAAQAIADSIRMKEDSSTDDFFSFATARVAALQAVKGVLINANRRGPSGGAGAIGRNKVSLHVWEGTQWLLRDEDRRVRLAYADALLTWLRLEVTRNDLRISVEIKEPRRSNSNGEPHRLSRVRSASGAQPTSSLTTFPPKFLAYLHLAIYEDILEGPERDADIALCYLVLVSLADRLGVHAVRYSLPMVLRLQDDIDADAIKSAHGRVNVGTLIFSYLRFLSVRFEFDTTLVGFGIATEIARREADGAWQPMLRAPPMSVDEIASYMSASNPPAVAMNKQPRLVRFESLQALVEQICMFYDTSVQSPPASPVASPSRVGTSPTARSPVGLGKSNALPPLFREAMLTPWSKASCIANTEKDATRSNSPRGSRAGTVLSAGNELLPGSAHTPREGSVHRSSSHSRTWGPSHRISALSPLQIRRSSMPPTGPGTPVTRSEGSTLRVDDLKRVLAVASITAARSISGDHASPRHSIRPRSSIPAAPDVQVTGPYTSADTAHISNASSSFVDAEGFESASEGDADKVPTNPQAPLTSVEIAHQMLDSRHPITSSADKTGREGPDRSGIERPGRGTAGTNHSRSTSVASAEDPVANSQALKDENASTVVQGSIVSQDGVPPVPPLPEGLVQSSLSEGTTHAASAHHAASLSEGDVHANGSLTHAPAPSDTRSPKPDRFSIRSSSLMASIRSSSLVASSEGNRSSIRSASDRRALASALLGSIEVSEDRGGSVGSPPY